MMLCMASVYASLLLLVEESLDGAAADESLEQAASRLDAAALSIERGRSHSSIAYDVASGVRIIGHDVVQSDSG